jgi:hypothetical protein
MRDVIMKLTLYTLNGQGRIHPHLRIENVLIMFAAKPLNVPLTPSVLIIRMSMSSIFHLLSARRLQGRPWRAALLCVPSESGSESLGPPDGSAWSRVLTVSRGYTTLQGQCHAPNCPKGDDE